PEAFVIRRLLHVTLRSKLVNPGGSGSRFGLSALPVFRGAWRTIHASERGLQGGPRRGVHDPAGQPRTRRSAGHMGGSGDPAGAELHAHPGADRLAGLRDAVLPGALATATHDDEVAV